jgi:hypothetical protein
MPFMNETKKLIIPFLDIFDKISYKNNTTERKIYKNIFKEMVVANKKYKSSKSIQKNIKEIKSQEEIPNCGLNDNKFMSKGIKEIIYTKSTGLLTVTNKIQGVNITLYFLLFNGDKNIDDSYIDQIFIFLNFILDIGTQVKSLTYYLYLTDEKKTLPINSINILGGENCNSGVTYGCTENGSVLIYRKEEWFKVLIHETFHSLCLDFNNMHLENLNKKMAGLISIKSEYNLFEAYTETLATILNSCFVSFKLINYKPNKRKDFLSYLDFCLHTERIHSLYQCVKVLDYMGLTYEIMIKNKKNNYNENTNVFAYYIIKCILLYYKGDFLEWCQNNNDTILNFKKTKDNINSFFLFIKSKYTNETLIKDIKIIQMLKKNNTLRMTIIN